MRHPVVSLFGAAIVTAAIAAGTSLPGRAADPPRVSPAIRPVPAHAVASSVSAPPRAAMSPKAVIDEYCLTCHDNDKQKGELTLEGYDPDKADARPDISEKIVRKLRARMMPPPGAERPPDAALAAFAASLEAKLDAAADAKPNPGRRTFQRLNRAEYAQSIKDILALDVDVATFLPPDTISHNFDNI